MHSAIQFEDRVSRSRSKHDGESSAEVCDRPGRTREVSQRQLPTDHDHAVPTREYQLDQSSPLPATAAADPVLEVRKTKAPTDLRLLTGSHHITSGLSTIRPELGFILCGCENVQSLKLRSMRRAGGNLVL
jgi:hypothetical protein